MIPSKLLTVVVPVYKVEKYINKCLDSLIVPKDQMAQLEVIVVNDGTPDNSAALAKEYERRFPEVFHVIDKENGGHGSAWNRGVHEATGKYLRFLDSDDWLSNFSVFLKQLSICDSDLVFTNVCVDYEDTGKSDVFVNTKLIPMKEYNANTLDWKGTSPLYRGMNYTNFHTCTYKTSLLKRCHPLFLEKIFYDDEILLVMPLCMADTFMCVDVTLYHYLLGREGQTMNASVRAKNLAFLVKSEKAMIDFYARHPVASKTKDLELRRILEFKIKILLVDMLRLSYNDSKCQMRDFMAFVHEKYPMYDGGTLHRLYRVSFPLCWLLYHFIRPAWAYFKVNILKK